MNTEDNKRLCRRFIETIFNQGELSSIWDFVSANALNHELSALGDTAPPQGQSPEWMADLVFLYRRAFPDLHLEIRDQVAQEDQVVTTLQIRGTHKNSLMTIAASGREIDVVGIRVDRVAEGKIAESWFHMDSLTMLRQIGALPELNRTPAVPAKSAPGFTASLPALLPRAGAPAELVS